MHAPCEREKRQRALGNEQRAERARDRHDRSVGAKAVGLHQPDYHYPPTVQYTSSTSTTGLYSTVLRLDPACQGRCRQARKQSRLLLYLVVVVQSRGAHHGSDGGGREALLLDHAPVLCKMLVPLAEA